MKIEITIVTESESLHLITENQTSAMRNAAGQIIRFGKDPILGSEWERLRNDAQSWVDARAGRETGQG